MFEPKNKEEFEIMLQASKKAANEMLEKYKLNPHSFLETSLQETTIGQPKESLSLPESPVQIKFIKTHPDAQLPSKAYSEGDNCFDLYCCEDTIVPPTTTTMEMVSLSSITPYGYTVKVGSALVPVVLKVAYITPGFGFVVKDKSGLGFKHQLSHYGGEIDNGYRGDMGIKIANYSDVPYTFRKGDKVAQIKIEKIWRTEISFTDEIVDVDCPRGEGGFGSSGK